MIITPDFHDDLRKRFRSELGAAIDNEQLATSSKEKYYYSFRSYIWLKFFEDESENFRKSRAEVTKKIKI